MSQLESTVFPTRPDLSCYDVKFDKVHRGLYRVTYLWSGDSSIRIGVVVAVKNATHNATWVFFPTKDFRDSFAVPYRGLGFGCSRRVAVRNFLDGKHQRFRTGASSPWIKSTVTCGR